MNKQNITQKKLDDICKSFCTGKLGWNREKRRDCRNRTMCKEVQRICDGKGFCPNCGYDLRIYMNKNVNDE